MFLLNANSKVILYHQPVNLHKGFDTLMSIVKSELQLDLVNDTYILFSNIRKDRIKILFFQHNNVSIFMMRFPRALSFKYQEGLIFDRKSFPEFIRKTCTKALRKTYEIK